MSIFKKVLLKVYGVKQEDLEKENIESAKRAEERAEEREKAKAEARRREWEYIQTAARVFGEDK